MNRLKVIASVAVLGSLVALFQNCSQQNFSAGAVSASQPLSPSAEGSINVNGTDTTASGTITVTSAPVLNSYCQTPFTGSLDPCFAKMTGLGTSAHPFEIRTAADFVCINSAPSAFWTLKQDVSLHVSDIRLPSSRPLTVISCFSGVLDGQYHRVTYTVDCQTDQCDLNGTASDDQKDVSLFEYITGASVSNMRVTSNYKNIATPYKVSHTQYISSVATDVYHSHLQKMAVTANIDAEGQAVSGFAIGNDDFKQGPPLTFYDQIDVDLTVNAARTLNYVVGVSGLTGPLQVTNSHTKLSGLTNPGSQIQLYFGLLGALNVDVPSVSAVLANSFSEGDARVCQGGSSTFAPFGLDVNSLSLVANVSNSFWTGTLSCSGGVVAPNPGSYRDPANLASVTTDYNFSPSIWLRGTGGKPALLWLSTH